MSKKIVIMLIALLGMSIMECHASELNNIKYFKTTYDNIGNIISNVEISETEYFSTQIVPYDANITTEYKQLSISVSGGVVKIECTWKMTPKVRSFDVIALRGENVLFNSNVIQGKQIYVKEGSTSFVKYNVNSSNTKIFGNGVGISMNLVDDASDYRLSLSIPYSITGNNPIIYGSYQHAVRNVSLNTSQKYLLNAKGYGKVILFDNPVNSYYDGMSGVSINL